jgi:hypothetical protein
MMSVLEQRLEQITPDHWEFTWCDIDLENGLVGDPRSPARETMGERGARGWEMVTVLDHSGSGVRRFVAFFKRRVGDSRD